MATLGFQCPESAPHNGVLPEHPLTHLHMDNMAAILADHIFHCIFLNENIWIPIKISLKFVPKSLINNISASVQIMAWRRPGDKPLSEPMMISLKTHMHRSASMS